VAHRAVPLEALVRPRPRPVRSALGLLAALALAAAALVAVPAPASAHPDPPEPEVSPDILAVRWQNDREVQFGIKFPGPDGPFPAPRDRRFDTCLVGNVDLATPQDPGGFRPTGPNALIWIPPHDDALDPRIGGYRLRALTDGFWVVPSDDAPPGAVLSRETPFPSDAPPNTIRVFEPITELAYAIRIGGKEIPLTSTARVRLALALGWVELDDSVGFGGTVWVVDRTPPFDPGPPPPAPPS
jgi:hypothetical protein